MIPPLDYVETDILLRNLKNGMEMVVSSEGRGLSIESPLVRAIASILSHGLSKPEYGFWHIVRDLTHPCTRQALARALRYCSDNLRRGLFWVYYTLIEKSLDSYASCLVTDSKLIRKHYNEFALVRDHFCTTKFILLLTSLSQVDLTPLDSTTCVGIRLNINKTFLKDDLSIASRNLLDLVTSLPNSPVSVLSCDSGVDGSMENIANETCWSSEATVAIASMNSAFSDCSLSSAAEPSVNVVHRRKRVSFHETVTGEEPKGTVWERRSCDVETMSWWKGFESGVGDKGEEAIEAVMEPRGVPEGSEDPQFDEFLSSHQLIKTPAKNFIQSLHKAPKPKRLLHLISHKMPPLNRAHLLAVYPGPVPVIPTDPLHDATIQQELDLGMSKEVSSVVRTLESLIDSAVSKIFKLIDKRNKAFICALTDQYLCFLSKELNKTGVNIEKIMYKEIVRVFVGPTPEHISILEQRNGLRSFLLCDDGLEFCSWLHYRHSRISMRSLDFIRLAPDEIFPSDMLPKGSVEGLSAFWVHLGDISKESSASPMADYLMFSVGASQKSWEPALIQILQNRYVLSITPTSKGLRGLKLPLSDCVSCCRSSVSNGRPHTFLLKFENKKSSIIVSLAASDDLSVSSWMQSLLFAIAACRGGELKKSAVTAPTEAKRPHEKPGHYLVSNESSAVFINGSNNKLLSRIPFEDVASLLVGPAYVVLELDCHEVQNQASDWVLYFRSEPIKRRFIETLYNIWPLFKQITFEHKAISPFWDVCEDERNRLDDIFQPLFSHLKNH